MICFSSISSAVISRQSGKFSRETAQESPGPGIPEEAGILLPLIRQYAPTKSILGVCLGEQAIGEAFGATLINLTDVHHGVCSNIRVTAKEPLFAGLEAGFRAGRYHSWAVSRENFPDCLEITGASSRPRYWCSNNLYNISFITLLSYVY